MNKHRKLLVAPGAGTLPGAGFVSAAHAQTQPTAAHWMIRFMNLPEAVPLLHKTYVETIN
jgi:hypothetical protein